MASGYVVELTFERPSSAASPSPRTGAVELDWNALRAAARKPQEYGRLLSRAIFNDLLVRKFFGESLAVAQAAGQAYRLRLRIAGEAAELHNLRWETLVHPDTDKFITQDANLHWSRELFSSDWSEILLRPRGKLSILIAVANPAELKKGVRLFGVPQPLSEIDVAGELQRARNALQGIGEIEELISPSDGPWKVTLENLSASLRQGCDIVYLVCHGALLADDPNAPEGSRSPFLVLELPDGRKDLVPGEALVQQIENLPAERRPRLIVLASCQSAGQGVLAAPEEMHSADAGALAALGPQLASSGIPAVVAMQDNVSMSAVAGFMPVFFAELSRDGEVEQAMALGRSAISKQSDWWVPVLFSRLRDGRLFPQDEPGPGAALYTPVPLPPPDDLPSPGPLPPGSRLIFPPNALFTGREKELKDLAGVLFYADKPSYQAVVVSGIGGSGKTQLAVELAYRYGAYLEGVHWLNAAVGSLEPDIVDCGLQMGVQPWPDNQPEQVAATLKAWAESAAKGGRRLIVLDNLEEPSLLRDWLPRLGRLQVLVTARREKWPRDLKLAFQPLDVLPRPESLALLRKLAPELESFSDAELDPVAERFGDLPLGLQLAGAYLRELDLSPSEYLDRLERKGGALLQEALPEDLQENPLDRELNLQRTFYLSWERLDPGKSIDAAAAGAFRAAGYCAPNTPIPEIVLQGAIGDTADEADFKLGLARLVGLGLLDETPAGPVIHPLLAEFARLQDSLGGESVLPALVDTLGEVSTHAINIGVVSGFLPLLPHLRQVGEHCLEHSPEQAALMFNQLAYLLYAMGDYPAASPYFEQSLAINREVLGEKSLLTAASLNNLGLLMHAMGEFAEARIYYEQALAIRVEVLGERHPDTAQSLNNLGMLLQTMGDYPAARPYLEQALAIWREVLGERHPTTATSLNNLGLLLQTMGDYAAARPYYEQSLAIDREILGDKHPETAISLNNLGGLLQAIGDYPAARICYEQALAIYREVLGERHPATAQSLNNLGLLLQAIGDYAAARLCYEQALAVRMEVLGENHPDTAQSLNNLGYLLQEMGDYAGARPYFEQALAIYREVLGERHPDTAAILNNLGYLLRVMGETAAARPYYEQALAINREVLGERHPATARSLNNLGYLLKAMGDYPAARSCYEQAVAINREVLGENHPDTAISLNNLGLLLYEMGDGPAARPCFEQVLAIWESTLGPDHPYTQSVRDNLTALDTQLSANGS